MNALQDSDALREKYAIRSQFREGAVANLTPAISGGNVVLSLEDNTIATALIMVNGAWEPIAPQTIALPAPKTSGSDTIYLHWALWRVTSDGHYNTSTTCLVDIWISKLCLHSPAGNRRILFPSSYTDWPLMPFPPDKSASHG